jgi:hypothetical protein
MSPADGRVDASWVSSALLPAGMALFLAGCGDASTRVHPSTDWLDAVAEVAQTVTPDPSDAGPFAALGERFTSAVPVYQLGSLEGPEHSVFGEIGGVAVMGDTLLVADQQAFEVRFFRLADGGFIGRFGRKGAGPGEFGRIEGLVPLTDGRLLVATNEPGFQLFTPTAEGFAETSRRILPTIQPFGGVCRAGDRAFVRAMSGLLASGEETEAGLVHAVDLGSLEPGEQFGDVGYTADYWPVNTSLSMGYLSCDTFHNVVVVAGAHLPYIRGYDADSGELRWTTFFSGPRMAPVREYLSIQAVGVDTVGAMVLGVTATGDGHVLVQFGDIRERGLPAAAGHETYVVSTADGSGARIQAPTPRILGMVPGGFVALDTAPWPTLSVHRFRP